MARIGTEWKNGLGNQETTKGIRDHVREVASRVGDRGHLAFYCLGLLVRDTERESRRQLLLERGRLRDRQQVNGRPPCGRWLVDGWLAGLLMVVVVAVVVYLVPHGRDIAMEVETSSPAPRL